jgi:hypothetical protein
MVLVPSGIAAFFMVMALPFVSLGHKTNQNEAGRTEVGKIGDA